MELSIKALTPWQRLSLWALVFFGFLAVLWFADYWFFSPVRRDPWLFPLLSIAVFWGVYRSLGNWILYYFLQPIAVEPTQQVPAFSGPHSVDILTTAMPGEPYDMFATTLQKIQEIRMPHQCYLLDGGNDPRLQALCKNLGVTHVNCQGIAGAKAGKVNYALRNFSHAEFVLVIDPDHQPKADLMDRVLPLFADPQIGFVQIVQAYYNTQQSFVANAAAEQTFGFYGPTLMSLHGLGIPTAIGANCIFRRQALDSIGGHAEHLAEDALTSMRIHARGWKSAYLPYRGSEGLVPADLASFFKQQYKWATGMFYLLFYELPKLLPRMSWASRLHYVNAGTFYLGGVASALTLFLPIILLLSKQYAVEFSLLDFALHIAPYALITTLTYGFLQQFYTHSAEKRIPWRSLVLDKATCHINVLALWAALRRKNVPYIPTPKEGDYSPMPKLVISHILIAVLSGIAILWGIVAYPHLEGGTGLMMAFAALNILYLLPAIIVALWPKMNWRNHA